MDSKIKANGICMPHPSHVETVVLLSQRKADDYVEVELELDELDLTSAESKQPQCPVEKEILNQKMIW